MQKQYITDPEDGAQYHPAVRDYEIPTRKNFILLKKKLHHEKAHGVNIYLMVSWFSALLL